MQKLSFFKGLCYGLILSFLMWGGIFIAIKQIHKIRFQPDVSNIDEPPVAVYHLSIVY